MKIIRYWILIGFTVMLIFSSQNIFGQVQWLPKLVTMQMPMMIHYHFSSFGTPFVNFDSSYDKLTIVSLAIGIFTSPPHYLKNKDTISITYSDQVQGVNFTSSQRRLINFVLDTITNTLYDFTIAYNYQSSPDGNNGNFQNYSSYVHFSSLKFHITGDTLIANSQGEISEKSIDSVFYDSYNRDVVYGDSYSFEDDLIDSLIDDTASYQCFVNFVLTKPADIVTDFNVTKQPLIISTSVPDHTIHFSFPSSDHLQTLFIYDILGREEATEEIPAGTTQYSIDSSRFRAGHYFVRLGMKVGDYGVY